MPLVKTRRPLIGAALSEGSSGELIWRGNTIGNNFGASILWADAPGPMLHPAPYFEVFDDFVYSATVTSSSALVWTSMDDGGTGTNAYVTASVAGGWFNILTAAAQDDYHGSRTPQKLFNMASGKKLWCEMRYSCTEAATNKAAILFGLSDTTTTGGLQTGSSGPLANFNGIVMYKNEGAMTLNGMSSAVSTQASVTAMATQVSGTTTRIGFSWDGTNVNYYTDVAGTGWTFGGQTAAAALSAATSMYLMYTIKAGSGGNAETLSVDYVRAVQLR